MGRQLVTFSLEQLELMKILDASRDVADLVLRGPDSLRLSRKAQFSVFENAFVSGSKRVDLAHGQRLQSGCVYSEHRKVDFSERRGGSAGDTLVDFNPWHLVPSRTANYVRGRHFYLGHLFAHYGHFITEGLSCLWPLLDMVDSTEFDGFVLQFPAMYVPRVVKPFQRDLWKVFGISPSDILHVEEDTVFESLAVPERALWMNAAHFSEMDGIYERIRRTFAPASAPASPAGKRLYLSRSKQENRSIPFEQEVESLFTKSGFDVLYPELLSAPQQISLFSEAAVIAGFSGSQLHNIVFTRPGTSLIELADMRSRDKPLLMQRICNEIAQSISTSVAYIQADESVDDYLGRLEREALNRAASA